MTVVLKTLQFLSKKPEELIRITDEILQAVSEAGVRDGLCSVVSAHTTTGIIVNEGLPDVLSDIQSALEGVAPLEGPYLHARFLPSYGATSNNAPGHIKSTLTGNHCHFVVADGKLLRGSAQEIYLAEFDGPQLRKVYVQVMGE